MIFWLNIFNLLFNYVMYIKEIVHKANIVEPDGTPHIEASHQDLQCLPWTIYCSCDNVTL